MMLRSGGKQIARYSRCSIAVRALKIIALQFTEWTLAPVAQVIEEITQEGRNRLSSWPATIWGRWG